MSRFRFLLIPIALVFTGAVFTACGSDEEVTTDADPQAVLERTFGPESAVESAQLDLEIDLQMEGDEGGDVTVEVSGPVAEAESDLPEMDLELGIEGEQDGEQLDFQGGLTMTGEQGFITLDGETYELDQSLMGQIRSQGAEAGAEEGEGEEEARGLFGDLDPESFLTDLSNEGTEDVAGAETIHVSGSVDTSAAVSELEEITAGAAGLQGIGLDVPGASELREVEETIGDVTFDIYTGAEDELLRRMQFSVPVEGEQSGSMQVTLTLSDVNESQEIAAPENARPFMDLVSAIGSGALEGLGIEDLGDLTELGDLGGFGGGAQGGGDGADAGGAGDGSGAGADTGGAGPQDLQQALEGLPNSEEVIECIQNAQSASDVVECEELVR